MATHMLRGAATTLDGATVIRAASAGIASIAAAGEVAIQSRGLCEKRRKPPPHHSILSIHSQIASGADISAQQVADDQREKAGGAIAQTETNTIAPMATTDGRDIA